MSLVDPKTNIVEIWLTDLARSSTARISSGGLVTNSAFWSPDGTRLMFRSNRNGIVEFFEKSAAGGGNDRLVLPGAQMPSLNLIPTDWSPDGRHIIFSAPAARVRQRFMAVACHGRRKAGETHRLAWQPDAGELFA